MKALLERSNAERSYVTARTPPVATDPARCGMRRAALSAEDPPIAIELIPSLLGQAYACD
jgi:hypothetical protein